MKDETKKWVLGTKTEQGYIGMFSGAYHKPDRKYATGKEENLRAYTVKQKEAKKFATKEEAREYGKKVGFESNYVPVKLVENKSSLPGYGLGYKDGEKDAFEKMEAKMSLMVKQVLSV